MVCQTLHTRQVKQIRFIMALFGNSGVRSPESESRASRVNPPLTRLEHKKTCLKSKGKIMYEEINYQENPFSSSPRLPVLIPSSHSELLTLCEELGEGHKVQTVTCAHCGTVKHYVSNCGSRLCEYCRMKSVNRTLSRKGIGKRKMTGLKFLTLTVKSVDSLSNKNTLAIRDYFRKLIRRQFWKKAVRGGIYAIEVTQTSNGFHYHIHAIYEGDFIHWAIIRAHWASITGGAYIIHVTRAQNARGAMDYLAKYISKIEKGNIKKEQYEAAFKGVKLLQYFGSW